ncbi:MAG: porin family protein [Kofleriaceae bacterium]|nr:porin family protein [Kofleriaceae bacterium]
MKRTILLVALLCAWASPVHAQWVASPYIDSNVVGDVETGRGGIGVSVGYHPRRLVGFELDFEWHDHFFNDDDVASLVPASGVDLNTDAMLLMGNFVAPYCVSSAAGGTWCPYGAAGLGVIRADFDANVFDPSVQGDYDTDQVNLAFNVGVGVMHRLTRLVGLRVDLRYIHALVDESAHSGGYFKDYDFVRASVGVTFGTPRL